MPAGRPSKYNDGIAQQICERLSRGEPLARICDDDAMPGYSTVRQWEAEKPEFLALSARAKQDGTHWLADDCLRISDDSTLDPADKRVRIDTRLRLIGKWNSRAYGDKVEHEVTGRDGGPVETKGSIDVAGLSLEQLRLLANLPVKKSG